MHQHDLHRVAFIGSYVPRRCGIATFTHDLRTALAAHLPGAECPVVAVTDTAGDYAYPPEVRFECRDGDAATGRRAAEFLELAGVDVVSLQHEFGIFGGAAGDHVLELLAGLRVPVHVTLHTVPASPTSDQRRVLGEIAHLANRLAVMTDRGRTLLRDTYGVAEDRIDVIPHGIPDAPPTDRATAKDRLGLAGRRVLLTFGLLSPGKGVEQAIKALPAIAARHPDVLYLVVGATHPRLLREQGERYRQSLQRLVVDLGLAGHVAFYDRFVDTADLVSFLAASDVYLTPYLNEDQITSGTLAYAFGCGGAVLSTPYWHARELLACGRGILVPFGDAAAIAREVSDLLADEPRLERMRTAARALGRDMTWSRVAARYAAGLVRARAAAAVGPRRPAVHVTADPLPRRPPPPVVLDHLWRLTDHTGLLQHATFDIPNLDAGYCTDDNARALGLMVLLEDLGRADQGPDGLRLDPVAAERATTIYAAFVGHAFDPADGRFRNFLGHDRRWLEETGSDDCLGRAVHALGSCIGRSRRPGLVRWAATMFTAALGAVERSPSPRGWALAILGVQEYLRRLDGDRLAAAARRRLVSRLLALHREHSAPGWRWFENVVAYENARPCQALISAGRWTGDRAARDAGLEMLDWLAGLQRSPTGRFAPVGCRGFLSRGGEPAAFDQQPIEAQATIAASAEAFHATGDRVWLDRAWEAFDWFHGRNVLGVGLCDPRTGGCRDGLLADRANENRGAESTLAYLGAVVEMRLLLACRAARTALAVPDRAPVGTP